MTKALVLISLFLGITISSLARRMDEPGDSLPQWMTSTVEVKTYRVVNPLSDSLFLSRYRTSDLGRALNQSGIVNVFQYGPNGTACLMRSKGLAPDHTQVLWNQVSLNSVTLGQADLSLIPMFFLDQIHISSPSYFSLEPNGGIGGTVNISAQLKKNEATRFWYQSEISSMRNIWNGIGCHIVQTDYKNRPVVIQLRAFNSNNANEFRYRNPYSFGEHWESQSRNNSNSRGLQIQFRKQWAKGNWSGQFWTLDRMSQLPAIIGSGSSMYQRQWDNQNRATYFYEGVSKGFFQNWKAGGVFLADRQSYWMYYPNAHQMNDTNDIKTFQSILFSEWERKKENQILWLRGEWREARVLINELSKTVQLPQVMMTWSNHGLGRILLNASGKWAKGPELIWNKTGQGSISYMTSGKWFKQIKLQGQWVERAPDFNELYWPLSGNTQLKSEQSVGSALYGTMEYQKDTHHRFRMEGNVENRMVKNWIQWVPQDNGIWKPMNIQEVESWHAEAKVISGYQWRSMQVQFFSYSEWNEVQGRSIHSATSKFDLPYVPTWKISHQLDITMKSWSAGINQRWISARYTDQNNSMSMQLPSVQLWSVFLSKRFIWKKQVMNAQLKCENLMNVQYQEVRSYALPGRVWSIQINYNIN